jgi:hypothetical protein
VEPAGAAALQRAYTAVQRMMTGVTREVERLALEAEGE